MSEASISSPEASPPVSRARLPWRVALAWLPLAALWTLITISADGTGLASAARFGFVSIGVAALLGIAVWHVTGRYPWPDPISPLFYAGHAAAAAVYAAAWMVLGMAVNSLILDLPLLTWHLDAFLTVWRFLMGLLLYGLIAGVSYAMRIREQLRRQERATLAAQALAAEARLEALRGRLNPHFLFNALHSVSELMHTDVHAAEQSIEDLAGLLRYSLDADGDDVVTVAEEWRFVTGYLAIERLRLGDRLRVDDDLSREALGARVPGFTLQVLVENAVRHAVADRPEGGSIKITARIEGERLVLEVLDDGPGMETGAASPRAGNGATSASRRDDRMPTDAGSRESGLGLALLRQRLAAAYSGAGSLVVDSRPQGGTRAIVTIPSAASGPV